MANFKLLKKNAALTAIVMLSSAFAEQPFGIIGGQDSGGGAYAALVSSTGIATPINLGITGFINSIAINGFGNGIIGGQDTTGTSPPYAAIISSSGIATPINLGIINGSIFAVAINASGQGLIGGEDGVFAYAAFVSPSGIATPINTGLPSGFISAVSINFSGQGLIGGENNTTSDAYAALVAPSGTVTPITLGINGVINSAAINASGQGLIGGVDNTSTAAYAAIISPSGTATSVSGLPNGIIYGVAINASGLGIIGGQENALPAIAAFVSPSGIATPINTGLSTIGQINSVAINASGLGIIGGQDGTGTFPAYAALVSPSSAVIPITLGLSNGTITSVAINDFGQGLIGGLDNNSNAAYAAIVSSSGIATPITLGFNGAIATVSLSLLSSIPTGSLSGNNLIFAKYINKNAPQDAFYFVPAVLDGTLSRALESAAPTRNAFSLYTASNNLFYLTTGLSNHLRNRSRYIRAVAPTSTAAIASKPKDFQSEELLASLSDFQKPRNAVMSDKKKNSIWFEAIGAIAYQKAQHQTPGFQPASGGAILAYDGKTSEHTRLGIGISYLFTHLHEKEKAGHSNINQEDLFIYGSWENKQFYLDGCLLGGLFQVDQVRKIHMTGFDFKSTSHPHGWQLLPHLELGYHYTRSEGVELTINPFIMVDWANAWQHSYKEKGKGPFNAGQKSHHSSLVRTEGSLRFYETLFFDNWDLVFQEKVGYVNVHSFGTGRVQAFLVGSPGAFTVSTLTSNQNLGVAELALIFAPHSSSLTSTIFYQGEFGSKYKSHQVALEFAWNF